MKVEYKESPAAGWDVDLGDVRQIDEDEDRQGLVGFPLDELDHVMAENNDLRGDDFDGSGSPLKNIILHELIVMKE